MLIFIFTVIVAVLGLAGVITHKVLKTKFESSITALCSKVLLIVGCIALVIELIAVGVGGSTSKGEAFTTERESLLTELTKEVGKQKYAQTRNGTEPNYDEVIAEITEFNTRLEHTKVSAESVWTNWYYPGNITAEAISDEEVNNIIETTPANTEL